MSDRDESSTSVFQDADTLYFNDNPIDCDGDDNDEIVFFGDEAPLVTPPSSLDDSGESDESDDSHFVEDADDIGDGDNVFVGGNGSGNGSDVEADGGGDDYQHQHQHSHPSDVYAFAFDGDDDDGLIPSSGYTRAELTQEVQVVQSSKDATTGKFLRETKDVRWCLSNGCEQVEPGIWSKEWYFTYLFGESGGQRAWSDAVNRRLVKQRDGKAFKLDNEAFCEMIKVRTKGNRAFSRGQFKSALDCYLKAEAVMGGAVSGMYLVPHQRAELVKILSNQAECYLRMNKFQSSILQSSAALQLDKRHEKSLLRRAKAIVYGAEQYKVLDQVIAAQVSDDLRQIISMKGDGVDEAKTFLDELNGKVQHTASASEVRQQ